MADISRILSIYALLNLVYIIHSLCCTLWRLRWWVLVSPLGCMSWPVLYYVTNTLICGLVRSRVVLSWWVWNDNVTVDLLTLVLSNTVVVISFFDFFLYHTELMSMASWCVDVTHATTCSDHSTRDSHSLTLVNIIRQHSHLTGIKAKYIIFICDLHLPHITASIALFLYLPRCP